MSDILIPMAADKRLDVGFDAMDSQIEYVRACAQMGCIGACDQGRKDCQHPMPAEACTEVGADDYSAADKEHSRFVNGVLMLVIYGLSALAAWHAFWLIVETLVEAAP